jgi:putative flippase GtrA
MIEKFIQFGLVGLSGLFVDFGITWLLKEVLRFNKYGANATGFLVAASSNYILNRIWTFSSTNPEIASEYLSFLAISVAGLAINSFILYLLVEKVSLGRLESKRKLKFYVSKLIAIGFVTIWNFIMNLYITFS